MKTIFKVVWAWSGALSGWLSCTTCLNLTHELASKNEIIFYRLLERKTVCHGVYKSRKSILY